MCATNGRWPTGSPAGCAGWLPTAASSCLATQDAPMFPGKRSTGLVREPVSEYLLWCVMLRSKPRPNRAGGLAVLPEIIRRQLCGSADLFCDHGLGFTPKAGTILQDALDLCPRFADRRPPARARLRHRRDFELQEVPQDPGDLRTQLTPVRLSQALD